MRFEKKFVVNNINILDIVKIIYSNPLIFREIYTGRFINNIYFDSIDLKCFQDNIRGIQKRFKFRIRWYGNLWGSIVNPNVEIKYKNGDVGEKKVFGINNFQLLKNINTFSLEDIIRNNLIPELKYYESFRPTLINSYYREYFISSDNNFRITLDKNIQFYGFSGKNIRINPIFYNLNSSIIEIKYKNLNNLHPDMVSNNFPFRLSKFSKYVEGIQLTFR
jgi:hypothetical protein